MNSAISAIIRHYEIIPKIFGSSGTLGICVAYVIASMIGTVIIHGCYDQIPQRHRNIHHTWMLWLLLFPLPLLSWYLIFSSTVGLSRSFKRAFADIGDDSAGDCGVGMSFIFAFNMALLQVPILTPILLPVLPVTGLFWLSQMLNLRSKLRTAAAKIGENPILAASKPHENGPATQLSIAARIAFRARQTLRKPYHLEADPSLDPSNESRTLPTPIKVIIFVVIVVALILAFKKRSEPQIPDVRYYPPIPQYP